jgi:death-on-curing protein
LFLPPLTAEEAEVIHLAVMANYPEEPSGILDPGLLDSTLNRSVNAALYEDADEFLQTATLLWGLIRNHPFVQGNKRTATVIAFHFIERAGYKVIADDQDILTLVYGIDGGEVDVNDAAQWLRVHAQRL